MRITHFHHACVLLETGSARILIDPGVWSHGFEDLRDLDAILITHAHADHVDADRLPALVAANPGVRLVVDPGTAADLAIDHEVTRPGERLELAGAVVDVVGGVHAEIHPEVEVPPNVGYVVDDGAFYHPGDSLFVPEQKIDVLALPTGAPWLKVSEAVEYFRAVKPRAAVPIHDLTLSQAGIDSARWRFETLKPVGSTFSVLSPGEQAEV